MALFPYMSFARSEAMRAPFNLASSGMPPADASIFGPPRPIDLAHAGESALATLEQKVAALHGVDPARVLITLGASGAMHLAALRFFRPDTRVVSETPSYEPLRALPAYLGADHRAVLRRPEARWQIDVDEVRRELRAGPARRGPGHVFVTNTHNPSGVRLSADTLRDLANETAVSGGVLISCEVYMEFAPPGSRTHAALVAPNGISLGSLTKAYGLGPLRAGWIVLGEGLAEEREALLDMTYLSYVDPPTSALRTAIEAFDHLDELRKPLEEVDRESRPELVRWLGDTPGIDGVAPDLGLTAFPRVEGVRDTFALQRHLAETEGVGVVPGEFFGLPGHLRIGCGLPPARLREALIRLTRGIESFRRAR
jgi:aspartate/methionine/tyrosine aminotransferase